MLAGSNVDDGVWYEYFSNGLFDCQSLVIWYDIELITLNKVEHHHISHQTKIVKTLLKILWGVLEAYCSFYYVTRVKSTSTGCIMQMLKAEYIYRAVQL